MVIRMFLLIPKKGSYYPLYVGKIHPHNDVTTDFIRVVDTHSKYKEFLLKNKRK
jgi:hypothetical protein